MDIRNCLTLELNDSVFCQVISYRELLWHLAANHLLPRIWCLGHGLGRRAVWMVLINTKQFVNNATLVCLI